MDRFRIIGISHKKSDLKSRERFIKMKPDKMIKDLHKAGHIKGYVFLNTCLRDEFYLELSDEDFIEVKKHFNNYRIEFFDYEGIEAIKYLFKVVCGLDSIIVGEDQILAQIKEAVRISLKDKTGCPVMNKIFNLAIALGKKFRHMSKISHTGLSLENIAVKFIEGILGNLKDKKVLILGIGDLAESILYLLKKKELDDIVITNRTHHKAVEVQKQYDVNTCDFREKNHYVKNSDIIISATSARHLILHYEDLMNLNEDGRERMFLDLAVPRDIDERLAEFKNLHLYNLDDLWNKYNENKENRDKIAQRYIFLIDDYLMEIKSWYEKRCEYGK